jgi:hypothetical protein
LYDIINDIQKKINFDGANQNFILSERFFLKIEDGDAKLFKIDENEIVLTSENFNLDLFGNIQIIRLGDQTAALLDENSNLTILGYEETFQLPFHGKVVFSEISTLNKNLILIIQNIGSGLQILFIDLIQKRIEKVINRHDLKNVTKINESFILFENGEVCFLPKKKLKLVLKTSPK